MGKLLSTAENRVFREERKPYVKAVGNLGCKDRGYDSQSEGLFMDCQFHQIAKGYVYRAFFRFTLVNAEPRGFLPHRKTFVFEVVHPMGHGNGAAALSDADARIFL
jgi:hypothetical protein